MAHEDGLERFLAWRQVRNLTGLGRTTAWRMRQAGDFPEPVPISPGRVAWRARDIAAWNESRGTQPAPRPPAPGPINLPSPLTTRPTPRRTIAPPDKAPEPPAKPNAIRPKPAPRRRGRTMVAEGQLGFDF